ncbi:hypothetical protein ACWC09_12300 [Streptomyces sp. NPDC001617]
MSRVELQGPLPRPGGLRRPHRPELRLITCGGAHDRRTGQAGNTVVFAHLTAVRGPGPAA